MTLNEGFVLPSVWTMMISKGVTYQTWEVMWARDREKFGYVHIDNLFHVAIQYCSFERTPQSISNILSCKTCKYGLCAHRNSQLIKTNGSILCTPWTTIFLVFLQCVIVEHHHHRSFYQVLEMIMLPRFSHYRMNENKERRYMNGIKFSHSFSNHRFYRYDYVNFIQPSAHTHLMSASKYSQRAIPFLKSKERGANS